MKYISFKILILCIILPPILYIVSIRHIESHLQGRYASKIEAIYTGDTRSLLDGSIRLKDAVNENIERYLKSRVLIAWGVKAAVLVATKHGTILYPATFEEGGGEGFLLPPDPMQVAYDNYNLMNEGLVVNVDIKLEHNTLLSNAILAFYILVSVLALYFYYKAGLKKAGQEDQEKSMEIGRLMELEKGYTDRLKDLGEEREKLSFEFNLIKKNLQDEKKKASRNEDEMIEDVVALEQKLEKNLALQNEQQDEIAALEEKIRRYEKAKQKDVKQKTKTFDAILKRFNTLYKNIYINERAISGFVDLTDDMKIKSEEIIHQLDQAPDLVPIKRKVFGKKGRETVFEVIFAYRGRLYYRKTKDAKIEVLVIGTKNTQAKDLEFLNNI